TFCARSWKKAKISQNSSRREHWVFDPVLWLAMKVKKIWNFGKMARKPSINPWSECGTTQEKNPKTAGAYNLVGMMTI
ncbi:hypothetical protein LTR40_012163, partial [Exophiala xenobiotica]